MVRSPHTRFDFKQRSRNKSGSFKNNKAFHLILCRLGCPVQKVAYGLRLGIPRYNKEEMAAVLRNERRAFLIIILLYLFRVYASVVVVVRLFGLCLLVSEQE